MKWYLIVTPIFFIFFTGFVHSENVIYISTPSFTSQNFTAYIMIQSNETLGGAQCNVFFNSSLIRAIDVKNGNMFDKWIGNFSQNFPTIDNENGKIENIIAFSLNNSNKSGIFAKIDFEIINEGVANINLTNVIISDKNANRLNMSIKNASISIDLKAPQTNITFGNPKYGLYIKSITPIWLNSTDNFGINSTYYRIWINGWHPQNFTDYNDDNITETNGSFWYIYSKPIHLKYDGLHFIQFFSIDKAGNVESFRNRSIFIDDIPPHTTCFLNGTYKNGRYIDAVKINLSSVDNLSGLKEIKYKIDNGTFNIYNNSIEINEEGSHTIKYYAIDNLGNEENIKTKMFNISKNIFPIANFSWNPKNPNDLDIIQFNASVSYDLDGYIALYKWDWNDDGIFDDISSSPYINHSWNENGIYNVSLVVIDNDGAMGSIKKKIEISNIPPNKPYSPFPANNSIGIGINVKLSWQCSDPDGNLTYDAYFGLSPNPPKVRSNITINSYNPGKLKYSTKYYWRIVAWDDDGAKNESQIWNFKTVGIEYNILAYPNPSNAGYITLNPSQSKYESGTIVTLHAIAYEDYIFDHWSGDVNGNDEIIQIEVDSNKTIIANFIHAITVDFSYKPPNPYAGEAIQFIDNSYGNIHSWNWDFGDGSTSNDKNPIHVYKKPGKYNVTLTIYANGKKISKRKILEVKGEGKS